MTTRASSTLIVVIAPVEIGGSHMGATQGLAVVSYIYLLAS